MRLGCAQWGFSLVLCSLPTSAVGGSPQRVSESRAALHLIYTSIYASIYYLHLPCSPNGSLN